MEDDQKNNQATEDKTSVALPSADLTSEEQQQYSEKADQLAKEGNYSKVHTVVFIHPETKERSVAYLSEPNFTTKLAIMDKSIMLGVYQAGEELMRMCILKEASDPIMYSEHPSSDEYRMGVIDYCLTMINRFKNKLKKK